MTGLGTVVVLLAISPAMACPSVERSTSSPPTSTAAPLTSISPSAKTASEGSANVNASDEDRAPILSAYRAMYRAMLDGRTDRLDALLDDQYWLTHITGYRQPKREWLSAIDSGEMRYHSAQERSVTIDVSGDTAVLVGRSLVTATIYGARGTWNLQLTTNYARMNDKWMAMRTVATTF